MQPYRSHRDHPRANITVVDPAFNVPLGHLLDLAPGGLGVSGRGGLPDASMRRLRLDLPLRVHGRRSLELAVEYRWHQYVAGGRWHAGFRITDVADEELEILEHLMTWYADP